MPSPLFRAVPLGVAFALCAPAAPPVALKDGWYVLNGRKTLLNALGYEPGARPGESPYEARVSHLDQIRKDLQVIRSAGFNAIRTWSELTEPELRVVQDSGLKVVFGIWLKPDEDFGDPKVVARDLEQIRRVLAYTHKYDCVVTYLVMNEPMPEHIHKVGAQATRDLWTAAVDTIHRLHPGVPVTISGNSAITEWVDMNLFDVYARNAYDYRDGANFAQGFAASQRALSASYGQGKPSLLTEFGRSVSRKGGGFYGGNTLQEQADALVRSYRDLLDAGVTGLCPFYFADGWWKAGRPAVHDDEPEEWFGFFGYRDAKDAVGLARPVWHALSRYNQALVAEPKNQTFYRNDIPLEVFCQPSVKRVRVIYQDRVLLEMRPDRGGLCTGSLAFPGEPLADRELVFEAWDGAGRLLKLETLVVLTGPEAIAWPTLALRTSATDLEGVRDLAVQVDAKPLPGFTLEKSFRCAYLPHKGWDRGEDRTLTPREAAGTFQATDTYRVPDDCAMLALYAGVELRFGRFTRTLTAHQYLFRGTWANPLRVR